MSPPRKFEDLRRSALNFWPAQIAARDRDASVVPRLIESQDKFISLLHVADASPQCWKEVLESTSDFPANLFLKHLMVLTDLGGEPLKRLRGELPAVFDDHQMEFVWRGRTALYRFHTLVGKRPWDNKNLQVDGRTLSNHANLTPMMEDVAMLLLHGGACPKPEVPDLVTEKCILGTLLGKKKELDVFVRQRYIWVSRITGGASANRLGHLAQAYVKERFQQLLPAWNFTRRTIPGVSQTGGRTLIQFDIVAESPGGHFCAIEVSFQVTTNSTIERKSGQAKSRHAVLSRRGHRIAYVIDGAGNFERSSAISTMCRYSDCTVTFADSELESLARFLQGVD